MKLGRVDTSAPVRVTLFDGSDRTLKTVRGHLARSGPAGIDTRPRRHLVTLISPQERPLLKLGTSTGWRSK